MAILIKNSINPLSGKQAFVASLEYAASQTSPISADRGICLDSDVDIQDVSNAILAVPLVTIHSLDFNDGRIFSLASTIRQQLNYKGDLRATGEILVDQLNQLKRCGVSSFLLSEKNNEQIKFALSELNYNPISRFR